MPNLGLLGLRLFYHSGTLPQVSLHIPFHQNSRETLLVLEWYLLHIIYALAVPESPQSPRVVGSPSLFPNIITILPHYTDILLHTKLLPLNVPIKGCMDNILVFQY